MTSGKNKPSYPIKSSLMRWALFFALLLIVILIGSFVYKAKGPTWKAMKEAGDARTIGIAALTYAADHGQSMPAELSMLLPRYLSPPSLLRKGYRYLPIDDLAKVSNRPDTIILVEKGPVTRRSKLRIAAFADGSVRQLTDSEYRKYMTDQGAQP